MNLIDRYWDTRHLGKISNFGDVPIIKISGRDYLNQFIKENKIKSILEIGSYDRSLEQYLPNNTTYKSMDKFNKSFNHDYNEIEQIKESFDLTVMFSVIEHLTFKEILDYFNRLKDISRFIYLTAPGNPQSHNICFDHKTPISCRSLEHLMLMFDYKPTIHRVHCGKLTGLRNKVSKFIGIDFCYELIGIGEKK